MKQIQKRDGRLVPFDKMKIVDAVLAAFKDTDNGELSDYAYIKAGNIADYIGEVANEKELTIEEIQDMVQNGLMSTKRKDVATNYILYRAERTRERNRRSQMMQEIGKKIQASDVQNQNANVDEYSFGGRRGEAANSLMKQYALDNLISKMARENHLKNEIYIHDLDSYAVGMHNCLSIPFDDLLETGFNTRQTDIRPANSVNTAFQLVAVIFQLQSLQQFGGVSATHLDWTMVPYVRKSFAKHYKDGLRYIAGIDANDIDYQIEFMLNNIIDYSIADDEWEAYNHNAYQYAMDMTVKETQQAVEGMYHNLNTLQSRSGNQLN